jgi:metallo-beta-lactamase class B
MPHYLQPIKHAILIITCTIIMLQAGAQTKPAFTPKVVYQSDKLIITQVAENSYLHTSYKQTNDFGKVPCNGLVVRHKNEAVIFDTPTNNEGAEALIKWVEEQLQCQISALIPTHFHDDCLGGLQAFHQHQVPSYAHIKTIELAKANHYVAPEHGFSDSLMLPVGDKHVDVRFFGEGHTIDNVVGYFAADKVLFGGCLIKEWNASKGYLGDANLAAWSGTVQKIKQAYPQAQLIVPGHGTSGNQKLLDYTIRLFQPQ